MAVREQRWIRLQMFRKRNIVHRDDASSPKYTLTLDEASMPATSNRTWDLSGQTFASAIYVVGDLSIALRREHRYRRT